MEQLNLYAILGRNEIAFNMSNILRNFELNKAISYLKTIRNCVFNPKPNFITSLESFGEKLNSLNDLKENYT